MHVDAPEWDFSLLSFTDEQNGARADQQESAYTDVSVTERLVKGTVHLKMGESVLDLRVIPGIR